MIEEIYLLDRKPYLNLHLTLLLIILLFITTFFAHGIYLYFLSSILLLFVLIFSPKSYKKVFIRLTLVVVVVSILTFNPYKAIETFLKGETYISISFLLFYIYPLRNIATKNKILYVSLAFLPYLEHVVHNILWSARLKGVSLDSKNPIKRVKSYIIILIPVMISALKISDDLELAIKVKGGI